VGHCFYGVTPSSPPFYICHPELAALGRLRLYAASGMKVRPRREVADCSAAVSSAERPYANRRDESVTRVSGA